MKFYLYTLSSHTSIIIKPKGQKGTRIINCGNEGWKLGVMGAAWSHKEILRFLKEGTAKEITIQEVANFIKN